MAAFICQEAEEKGWSEGESSSGRTTEGYNTETAEVAEAEAGSNDEAYEDDPVDIRLMDDMRELLRIMLTKIDDRGMNNRQVNMLKATGKIWNLQMCRKHELWYNKDRDCWGCVYHNSLAIEESGLLEAGFLNIVDTMDIEVRQKVDNLIEQRMLSQKKPRPVSKGATPKGMRLLPKKRKMLMVISSEEDEEDESNGDGEGVSKVEATKKVDKEEIMDEEHDPWHDEMVEEETMPKYKVEFVEDEELKGLKRLMMSELVKGYKYKATKLITCNQPFGKNYAVANEDSVLFINKRWGDVVYAEFEAGRKYVWMKYMGKERVRWAKQGVHQFEVRSQPMTVAEALMPNKNEGPKEKLPGIDELVEGPAEKDVVDAPVVLNNEGQVVQIKKVLNIK